MTVLARKGKSRRIEPPRGLKAMAHGGLADGFACFDGDATSFPTLEHLDICLSLKIFRKHRSAATRNRSYLSLRLGILHVAHQPSIFQSNIR